MISIFVTCTLSDIDFQSRIGNLHCMTKADGASCSFIISRASQPARDGARALRTRRAVAPLALLADDHYHHHLLCQAVCRAVTAASQRAPACLRRLFSQPAGSHTLSLSLWLREVRAAAAAAAATPQRVRKKEKCRSSVSVRALGRNATTSSSRRHGLHSSVASRSRQLRQLQLRLRLQLQLQLRLRRRGGL